MLFVRYIIEESENKNLWGANGRASDTAIQTAFNSLCFLSLHSSFIYFLEKS